MTIRLETTCEQCGTTVHSLAYGYSDHFSRNMWHLQCSACGRLTTEQPFDWGDFPASPQQSVITWIPVSERLPEDDMEVLITYLAQPEPEVWTGHQVKGRWYFCDSSSAKDWDITHWAELPSPPAGEEGEG